MHPLNTSPTVEVVNLEPRRRGDWIQTFTGKAFYILDPRVEDVEPVDIAHALGMLCRYGGHTRRFYSVAEHCVLMSHAVSPKNALWALLHDATEAYVQDVVRPLKHALPAYVAIEDHLMGIIARRFDIAPDMPPEVKDADNRILLNERAALLGSPPIPRLPHLESLEPLDVEVTGWDPDLAALKYMQRLVQLGALAL